MPVLLNDLGMAYKVAEKATKSIVAVWISNFLLKMPVNGIDIAHDSEL